MKILLIVAAGAVGLAAATPGPAAASPREYNRGYYDCLAGRFDEDAQSRAYRQGCQDAQREQADQGGRPGPGWGPPPPPPQPGWGPPPQPGWGPPPGQPGWRPNGGRPPVAPVGIPGIIGMDGGRAIGALASYGYRNVGTGVGGGAILGVYFNPRTGECVEVANVNGRVVNARATRDGRCR